MPDTWDYSDEQALLAKSVRELGVRVEALERQCAQLIADLTELRAGVQRAAEYQGVTHLLSPQ
jgi:hypothetical protein